MSEVVRKWYDERSEYEWGRLFQDGFHQLEFLVTMHFLEKYLPKEGLILDAGGGPGRYTIELAKRGYGVVLLDLSPRCLEVAKEQTRKAGVQERIVEIVEGSVTDLSRFMNDSFDGVLCLGAPLSHLIEDTHRVKAAGELVRVAKKGAPLFVSVLNRYGLWRVLLRSGENLTGPFPDELFDYGTHRSDFPHPKSFRRTGGFTEAHLFHPSELRRLMEESGVSTLTMATCEGLSSDLEEATNVLYKDSKQWQRWFSLLLETCTDPCILGFGTHLLYVGKKG